MTKYRINENKIVKVEESETNEVWLKKLKVGDTVMIEKESFRGVIASAVGEIIKIDKNGGWNTFEVKWEIGSRKYKVFFDERGVKPIDERKSWIMKPFNDMGLDI